MQTRYCMTHQTIHHRVSRKCSTQKKTSCRDWTKRHPTRHPHCREGHRTTRSGPAEQQQCRPTQIPVRSRRMSTGGVAPLVPLPRRRQDILKRLQRQAHDTMAIRWPNHPLDIFITVRRTDTLFASIANTGILITQILFLYSVLLAHIDATLCGEPTHRSGTRLPETSCEVSIPQTPLPQKVRSCRFCQKSISNIKFASKVRTEFTLWFHKQA